MDVKKSYSRPADKTWQAYRDWILGIREQMNPSSTEVTPDATWKKWSREFWGTDKKKTQSTQKKA